MSARARRPTSHAGILENESQRSGVPSFLRTALLPKRRANDDGQFLGHVSMRYKISPFADFKETVLNALAVLPRDDPIIFDPNYPNSPSAVPKSSSLPVGKEALSQEVRVKFQQSLDHGRDDNTFEEEEEPSISIEGYIIFLVDLCFTFNSSFKNRCHYHYSLSNAEKYRIALALFCPTKIKITVIQIHSHISIIVFEKNNTKTIFLQARES